jgi:hypothetical protein
MKLKRERIWIGCVERGELFCVNYSSFGADRLLFCQAGYWVEILLGILLHVLFSPTEQL